MPAAFVVYVDHNLLLPKIKIVAHPTGIVREDETAKLPAKIARQPVDGLPVIGGGAGSITSRCKVIAAPNMHRYRRLCLGDACGHVGIGALQRGRHHEILAQLSGNGGEIAFRLPIAMQIDTGTKVEKSGFKSQPAFAVKPWIASEGPPQTIAQGALRLGGWQGDVAGEPCLAEMPETVAPLTGAGHIAAVECKLTAQVIGQRAPRRILEKLIASPAEQPGDDHSTSPVARPPSAGALLWREALFTARR